MIFREVENTSRNEDEFIEKGLEKMGFGLNVEASDSFEEVDSLESNDEVEPYTIALRRSNHVRRPIERYSPHDFHYDSIRFSINDEPRYVKKVVNSEEGKLWKKSMVDEMDALEKNES